MSHYKSGTERRGGYRERSQLKLAPLVAKQKKMRLCTHTVNLEEDNSSTPNSIVLDFRSFWRIYYHLKTCTNKNN